SGQYVQERSVEGVTVVVCTGEECGGCDSGQYVQERSVEGVTVGSMYRRGEWWVRQWAVRTGEKCEGCDNGQYVQERSVEGMTVVVCTGEECGG
ncbi:unnamed protein product, partial [Staurois parvus]